jgi:hypothetical protein
VIAGCAGLVFAVDYLFKAAVSAPDLRGQDGTRAVALAENGFLSSRRAVYLTCSPGGQTRVVTKARLAERSVVGVGFKAAGEIHVSEWERRGRGDLEVKVPMTVVSKDWVDILESDDLPRQAFDSIAFALRNPAVDFIAIHTLEHGIFFRLTGASTDLRALERCVSG